jgi:D-tyrosyl-tRNA(Tyr) deacylase
VDDDLVAQIGVGILLFLGIRSDDTPQRVDYLTQKVTRLRIFPDTEGKMNRSLLDTGNELLVVSQFTLYADTHKGNRPSYAEAARPQVALPLYELFVAGCRNQGVRVATGVFQAHMRVALVNDGPVTVMCYSET